LNNNIAALRGLHKNEHYSDSINLLNEAISNPQLRQSEEQLSKFRLNKVILMIQKGKLQEAGKAL